MSIFDAISPPHINSSSEMENREPMTINAFYKTKYIQGSPPFPLPYAYRFLPENDRKKYCVVNSTIKGK
jgi:endoglucanase Acf2